MKGIQGLIIAVVLGLVGFAFNMFYLSTSRDFEHDSFIGVRKNANVKRGTSLKKSHLEKIAIPKEYVGNLKEYALPYSSIDAILGRKSIRNYERGGLLLRNDFRTAPSELRLTGGETAISVPIDTRTTITSQIVPGETKVSFYIPAPPSSNPEKPSDYQTQWIGPFDVLTVGSRMGSADVIDGQSKRSSSENMLTLKTTDEAGRQSSRMTTLLSHLTDSNFKPLRLKIHAASTGKP